MEDETEGVFSIDKMEIIENDSGLLKPINELSIVQKQSSLSPMSGGPIKIEKLETMESSDQRNSNLLSTKNRTRSRGLTTKASSKNQSVPKFY